MLLSNCHSGLRLPSELLDLCVECGRVNHIWCMGDMHHMYGGLCVLGWMAWLVSMLDKARELVACLDAAALPESEVKTRKT